MRRSFITLFSILTAHRRAMKQSTMMEFLGKATAIRYGGWQAECTKCHLRRAQEFTAWDSTSRCWRQPDQCPGFTDHFPSDGWSRPAKRAMRIHAFHGLEGGSEQCREVPCFPSAVQQWPGNAVQHGAATDDPSGTPVMYGENFRATEIVITGPRIFSSSGSRAGITDASRLGKSSGKLL